ncbi:MAG: hypothetical protein MK207_01945 [Saprospiraceae bacterium]|nr:hypothetical protein [Saprospiraceae bacterium]
MHTLEPHYKWRMYYIASEDQNSPFFGRVYSEFEFSTKIYNYFIHPQWDDFGSETLYAKILYVNYIERYTIIELIGEWNDCLNNDVMLLKQAIIDRLQEHGICKFILIAENVLNFHASDDCYYEEWYEDVIEEGGWISFVGLQDHVIDEMLEYNIQDYVNLGEDFNIIWRPHKPEIVFEMLDNRIVK